MKILVSIFTLLFLVITTVDIRAYANLVNDHIIRIFDINTPSMKVLAKFISYIIIVSPFSALYVISQYNGLSDAVCKIPLAGNYICSSSSPPLPKDSGDRCDELAGDPADNERNTAKTAVNDGAFSAALAVETCFQAVRDFPNVPRYRYQLSRSLDLQGDQKRALEHLKLAAEAGHMLAKEKLARMGPSPYPPKRSPPNEDNLVTQLEKRFAVMAAQLGKPGLKASIQATPTILGEGVGTCSVNISIFDKTGIYMGIDRLPAYGEISSGTKDSAILAFEACSAAMATVYSRLR